MTSARHRRSEGALASIVCSSARSDDAGSASPPPPGPAPAPAPAPGHLPRRAAAGGALALGALGALGLGAGAGPARAAYGEAANVFGKTANTSGYVAYEGDGFRLSLPAKWGPSSEREFDGTVLRYVDNAAQANNLTVTVTPTDAKSVREVAPLEKFLEERAFLFGSTSGSYATASEGGFAQDTVQEFDLLESFEKEGAGGRPMYMFEVLARTNDGDEGGRHHLVAAAVSGGQLFLFKVTAGEKRWFRGAKKACLGAWNSFEVA